MLAVLMWVALGAGISLVCVVLRGRRIWKNGDPQLYGSLLGRKCRTELRGEWIECTVVAVSWKGAMAVRHADWKAFWIAKEDVADRVRWEG